MQHTRAFIAALTAFLMWGGASAQWPMQARDGTRDAASSGTAALSMPAVAWRRYMGGAVQDAGVVSRDLDADGAAEVLYLAGGRLVCKRSDDRVVWETPSFGLSHIVSLVDLNGDGTDEVLTYGRPAVVAVFSLEGELLWRTEPDTFGVALGVVRVGQLVPGGPPEVYATDRISTDAAARPDAVYAFSFADGFGSGRIDAATTLWRIDASHRDDAQGFSDVLADLDGDGASEILSMDEHAGTARGFVHVYAGTDGRRLHSGAGFPLGVPLARGLLLGSRVADLDGDGDDEVILATNTSGYGDGRDSRGVIVLDWDAGRPADERLYRRWSRLVDDPTTDAHFVSSASIGDVDGDGDLDIATSLDEDGVRTVHLFDGPSGESMATLPGAQLRGVLDLDGTATLLVQLSGQLRGFAWSGDSLAERFAIEAADAAFAYARPWNERSHVDVLGAPITLPLADGRTGIVTATSTELRLWDPASATTPVATFTVEDGERSTLARQTDVGRAGPGLLVLRTDGFLEAVDAALQKPDPGEFVLRGLRVGGYYSGRFGRGDAPVGGHVGGTGHAVLMRDAQGDLLRIDASDATLSVPPGVVWRAGGTRWPALHDEDGDGRFEEVVGLRGRSIVGVDTATGADTFSVGLAEADMAAFTSGPVVLQTGGGPRFAAAVRTRGGFAQVRAASRSAVAWSSVMVDAGSSIAGYPARHDFDGDGDEDLLLAMLTPVRIIAGATGADVSLPGVGAQYPSMPILLDPPVGSINVIANGGNAPSAVQVSADSATRHWSYPADWRTLRHFATVVRCPTPTLVGAVAERPVLGVTPIATHEDGAPPTTLVLSQGVVRATEADITAGGDYPGALGNVTSIADLDGTGRPAALVGSTDGFLYAVDPCGDAPSLIWALDMRAPVGEAVWLDVDGDAEQEIVVSTADGFLQGIDGALFPSPSPVLDVQPGGALDVDVDVTRGSRLAASWAAVPGALGYEWAVFTEGGTPVSRRADDPTNPFLSADADVTYAEYAEGLEDGTTYLFAVRALGPEGASPEAVSDGTRFVAEALPVPDAGPGTDAGVDAGPTIDGGPRPPMSDGGCGCRTGRGPSAGWIGLFTLLFVRRRSATFGLPREAPQPCREKTHASETPVSNPGWPIRPLG